MPKYKEYDFNYECDIDNIKVTRHVKDVGEIYINEDHVESEKKNVFVDDENIRYHFNKVTMVSGAVHYLLMDKHEYQEDNTEKFVLAIYSNGKKQGYVQCTDTKFVNHITYVPVFEKKHATVFTLYPETDTDEAGIAWGSMTNDDAMCYSDFINNFEPFAVVKESV